MQAWVFRCNRSDRHKDVKEIDKDAGILVVIRLGLDWVEGIVEFCPQVYHLALSKGVMAICSARHSRP